MITTLRKHIDSYRAMRVRHKSRHWRALGDIPPGLYDYWSSTAHTEFKGIPRDAFFFTRAVDGLLDFFECASYDGALCALPSRAADSVWHAWLRLAPDELRRFCQTHFGRAIVHVDGPAFDQHGDRPLANCLVRARRLARLPLAGPKLPALFTLDRRLRMPRGVAYVSKGESVLRHRLDLHGGKGALGHQVESLSPLALLAAGGITEADYLDFVQRQHDGSGASLEFGFDSADGGGDGGGCGGCGGGCGG